MKIVFCALTLCVSAIARCQDSDSLVYFNEIKFSSDFEKNAYSKARRGQGDPFSLFIADGSLLTDRKIEESRTRFFDHLNSMSVADIKKNEKKIKYVYDDIQKAFLKKFEFKNRFEEIFHNGYFNSISASALFALTFDKLKIPYTIKEDPSSVYLIAYPNAEKIMVNTASSLGGHFELTSEFKQGYIDKLKEQKLIPESEYNASSTQDLFDKYYFDQSADITLNQLAAIQYMNDATFLTIDKKFREANNQLQKAYLLYPSPRNFYLLLFTAVSAFENHAAKDSVQATMLARLSRFREAGLTNEMMVGEFEGVIQKLLFQERAEDKIKMYHRVLMRGISNEKLNNDLDFLFHYHFARYYMMQSSYSRALPYLESSLSLKPADIEVQTNLIAAIANSMKTQGSADEVSKTLDVYANLYASLKDHNSFNSMRAHAYLFGYFQKCNSGDMAAGEKYRLLFEELMKTKSDIPVDANLVGQSYSQAAVYYYKKGQVSKARQIIDTGLKFAPNSYELRSRKQMIK